MKMLCENCGQDSAQIKPVSKIYGKEGNQFIIENLPAIFCNNCGESYFTSVTLKEIDRIKKQNKSDFIHKEYPVANFIAA